MRGLSQKAKIEGYDALERERNLWQRFAWHTVNKDAPDGVERVSDGEGAHEIKIYGAIQADGAIVVDIFRHPRQRAHVEIARFSEWEDRIKALPFGKDWTPYKIAAERLHLAERRVIDAERDRRT